MRVATPCTRLDEKRASILRKSLRTNHYRFLSAKQFGLRCGAAQGSAGFLERFERQAFIKKVTESDRGGAERR